MTGIFDDNELIVGVKGSLGLITLNRPGALNALSLEMIRLLSAQLRRWASDDAVQAVFITGAGDRAFCAGGDMKAVYQAGMDFRRGLTGPRVPALFFAEEYTMNRQLFHYKKPLIAFMNGIVMGGGFGVAGPCRYRIACDNTVFAMPECGIGFFPDVGSAWFLNRAPGRLGRLLGLGGMQINPAEMKSCGLLTHHAGRAGAQQLADAVAAALAAGKPIEQALEAFAAPFAQEDRLAPHRALIDACFAADGVTEILRRLKASGVEWAAQEAARLETKSPVSLKVTLRHLSSLEGRDFDAVTAQDYQLAQHFLLQHDMYEGVRAVLVDKDKAPRWSPATLDAVPDGLPERFFAPAGHTLEEAAA